jgi:hypothetical protein
MQSERDEQLLSWLAGRADGTGAEANDGASGGAGADTVAAAEAVLTAVCPTVTGLLAFDHRFGTEVRNQLRHRDHPASLHAWGLQFATRLVRDTDPWISWAAQVDAGTLAADEARGRTDQRCPGDPMHAIMLIASGTDPRRP